jgi:hypothetical protein
MSHAVSSQCARPASAFLPGPSTHIISKLLTACFLHLTLNSERPEPTPEHPRTQYGQPSSTTPESPQDLCSMCRNAATSVVKSVAALATATRSARRTIGLSTSFCASRTRTSLRRLRRTTSAVSTFRVTRTSHDSPGSRLRSVFFVAMTMIFTRSSCSTPCHLDRKSWVHQSRRTLEPSTLC